MAGFGGDIWGAHGGSDTPVAAAPSTMAALTQGSVPPTNNTLNPTVSGGAGVQGQVTQQFVNAQRRTAPNGAQPLLVRLSSAQIPGVAPWLSADSTYITADSTDVTVDL